MKLKHFVLTGLVFALLTGCARPPVAEMDNAREAVVRAENDADAVLYASGSLARARDSLNRMQTEAESKQYDSAKNYAAEAIAAAEKAITDGKAGAARAREEASALMEVLPPAITETAQSLQAAQAAGLQLDYPALNSAFDGVRSEADEAQSAFSNNQYQDALGKGRMAQGGIAEINQRLSTAATASSRKK